MSCALTHPECLALPCDQPACQECLAPLSLNPAAFVNASSLSPICLTNAQSCAILQCVSAACRAECGTVQCAVPVTCSQPGTACTRSADCCGYVQANPEPSTKPCGVIDFPTQIRCYVSMSFLCLLDVSLRVRVCVLDCALTILQNNVCTHCQLNHGGSCFGANTACCDSTLQCARHVSVCDSTFPCDLNTPYVLGEPRVSQRCVPTSALRQN